MDSEEQMQLDGDEEMVAAGQDSDYEDIEEGSDSNEEESGEEGSVESDEEDEGILGDGGVSAKPKTKKEKLKKLGVEDGKNGEGSKEKKMKPKKAYLPGMQLKDGETLECDESAYVTLHTFTTVAPCLSFDIIPDSLGPNRTKFPLTSYAVGGTQAQRSHANSLIIMKVINSINYIFKVCVLVFSESNLWKDFT